MNFFKIAIFGLSGSGKSTGGAIAQGVGGVRWIEASRDILERRDDPERLPFRERHAQGFEYFQFACNEEGFDWAARRVNTMGYERSNTLVTGVRGVENCRRLKEMGFYCIFLHCEIDVLIDRLVTRDEIEAKVASAYLSFEARVYEFKAIQKLCDYEIDTTSMSKAILKYYIFNMCLTLTPKIDINAEHRRCAVCANSQRNPSVFSTQSSVCDVCKGFDRRRNSKTNVLEEILSDISKGGSEKALLGISGGKDSTASALFLQNANCRFETFTVDTGYYPVLMLDRARDLARKMGIKHHQYDARKMMNADIKGAYAQTADFFDGVLEGTSPEKFLETYRVSRKHYSAKDTSQIAFPRVCVLCRKSVIRSYYDLACRFDAKYVILGINEWATLSAGASNAKNTYSGIRKLNPGSSREVTIVHLPFLLESTLTENKRLLSSADWTIPEGEDFVETNSNSCLLAKCSEGLFYKNAGFHPDSTRLSREVTAGFLQRGVAITALSKLTNSPWSIREALEYAEIL